MPPTTNYQPEPTTLSKDQRKLLDEALATFGLELGAKPLEVLAYRFFGSPENFDPLRVTIVTAGGLKVTWPMDEATENRLRVALNAFRVEYDKQTRERRVVPEPLPSDLRLPAVYRNGVPPKRTPRPS